VLDRVPHGDDVELLSLERARGDVAGVDPKPQLLACVRRSVRRELHTGDLVMRRCGLEEETGSTADVEESSARHEAHERSDRRASGFDPDLALGDVIVKHLAREVRLVVDLLELGVAERAADLYEAARAAPADRVAVLLEEPPEGCPSAEGALVPLPHARARSR